MCVSKEAASFPIYVPRGTDVAWDIIAKSDKFLVYFDPDIDGLFAGILGEVFLTNLNEYLIKIGSERRISYDSYMNSNRRHGFTLSDEQVKEIQGRTVLAVDFAISPDDMRRLVDSGVNIVNIDHHEINLKNIFYYESEKVMEDGSVQKFRGITLNNQYHFEPERFRFLSGAGMVYYALSAAVPSFATEENKAMVGMTLLSDIREIEGDDAREFLKATFRNNSPRFRYYIDMTKDAKDYEFGVANMDRNFVDYKFAPKINALFRLNKNRDAMDIARMQAPEEMRKDLNVFREMQKAIIDIIHNNISCSEKKGLYIGIINKEEMDALMPYANVELTNFVGVACSRVRDNFGKTTLLFVMDADGKILRGSVRGKFDNVDYLDIFRKHGLKCDGHKVAFGVNSLTLKDVNLDALSNAIIEAEQYGEVHQFDGRIQHCQNLALWNMGHGEFFAVNNNFLRDSKRVLVRYEGPKESVKCTEHFNKEKGKVTCWTYDIDGIIVKAFEENMTPFNCLLLTIASHTRGENGYVQYYLRRPN